MTDHEGRVVLGLADGPVDAGTVRRAYLGLVRAIRLESAPERFMKLRESFELLAHRPESRLPPESPGEDPVSLQAAGPDPYSTIVYAARATDVRTTIVDGEVLVDAFTPTRLDPQEIAADASAAARELAVRARV